MSESLLAQAVAAHRVNDIAEAERLYLAALAEQPDRADARYNLGLIYGQQNRPADALRELQSAVAIKPDFGEAWFMLCEFADQLGQQELNLKAGEQATHLMPENARAWLRYGLAFSRLERDDDAIGAYRRAIDLDPALIKAWVNLAYSCKAAGRPQESETAIRKAIEMSGQTLDTSESAEEQYTFLHYHLALLELAQGHYRDGFAHFRARFKGGTDWKRFQSAHPLWRGENLTDKTILVTSEQGFGDVLMMARYLPMLKNKGAHVIFQTHPALVRLFAGWNGIDEVVPLGTEVDRHLDYHVPIFDLPYRFGTTLETVPARVPYLPTPLPDEKTDLAFITRKSRELFARAETPRQTVGIIWAGQPAHQNDKNRSLSLSVVADLFAEEDWQFFNLTRDMRPGEDEALLRQPIINLAPLLDDFADTARLIDQLDLIITCDTAAAHLAGGMGKDVWVLLPFAPDWRWGFARDDSPWYPTMRLFRQTRKGDWCNVIAAVRNELRALSLAADETQTARTAS